MKRPVTFAITMLLAGCASKSASDLPSVLPEPPIPPPTVQHVVPPPTPTRNSAALIAKLSPPEIIIAADQARADATGYVAWKKSKAENIDRLGDLVKALSVAVAHMQAGRTHGKYAPTDIIAARGALRELREFLANKGD